MMLLGREDEFSKIEELIKSALKKDSDPLSIYIGGTPGTGKTATVRLVIEKLRKSKLKFEFVLIDCFECSTAADLYRRILDQLNANKLVASNRLGAHLEKVFKESKNPIIILMDEIDRLSNSKTDVLTQKAFAWPEKCNGNVITIGISNVLDLVERILPKLRVNLHPPKVITYSPYTKQQLVKILKEKLMKEGVDDASIELCARKVSALTGDVRRAFHIANGLIFSLKDDFANAEDSSVNKNISDKDIDAPSKLQENDENNMKRPLATEKNVSFAPKKNYCREVLKEIDMVYASPLLRAQLPLHPRILLATFMHIINSSAKIKFKCKQSNSMVVLRDKLFSAYAKVCTSLSYGVLNSEELGNAFAVLESQGMISQKPKGRVAFEVEMEIARKVINDNVILNAIERVDLT